MNPNPGRSLELQFFWAFFERGQSRDYIQAKRGSHVVAV